MKLAVAALAAVLLSSCSSKASQREQPVATQPAPSTVALAIPEAALLPDPAPADAQAPAPAEGQDPAPSPEEVAAFQAPVPK